MCNKKAAIRVDNKSMDGGVSISKHIVCETY